jgi:hypothetical protein
MSRKRQSDLLIRVVQIDIEFAGEPGLVEDRSLLETVLSTLKSDIT